jgi:hypothetical protein
MKVFFSFLSFFFYRFEEDNFAPSARPSHGTGAVARLRLSGSLTTSFTQSAKFNRQLPVIAPRTISSLRHEPRFTTGPNSSRLRFPICISLASMHTRAPAGWLSYAVSCSGMDLRICKRQPIACMSLAGNTAYTPPQRPRLSLRKPREQTIRLESNRTRLQVAP